MTHRLATPAGTGETVQACSNCGRSVRYVSEYRAWMHLDATRICAPHPTKEIAA